MGKILQRLVRKYTKNKRGYYTFLCKCGQTTILRGDSTATTCQQEGCTETTLRKHGKSHTRLYGIWEGIRARCLFTHHSNKHYKYKNIIICNDWNEFSVFYKWAATHGYQSHLTIDRKNINEGYTPENCEWVTRSENTKRQCKDRLPQAHKIALECISTGNITQYRSIASAARFLFKTNPQTLKSLQTTMEIRVKTHNLRPYKGYILRLQI